MNEPVVLLGGPRDGIQITVDTGTNTITAVTAEIPPWQYHAPRPRWWLHPIAWVRWKPPPPPEPPRMIQLEYRREGTVRDGLPVFRLQDGEWRPYRGPGIDPGQGIYPAMVTALYAVPPQVRQDPATRWVMSRDWYDRVRAHAVTNGEDPEPDPEKRVPAPGDRVLGVLITVTEDGGAPHIENPRMSAGTGRPCA